MVRWLKLIVGLVITGAFLWLIFRGIDMAGLRRAFAGLSLPLLVLALVFLAAAYMVRIVRWWWMLWALEPSLRVQSCIGPFMASLAVNNVLPFRAGDALRVVGFRRKLSAPMARVFGTVVIERVLDLVTLLGFFFIGLVMLPSGVLPGYFVWGAELLVALVLGGVLLAVLLAPWLRWILNRISSHSFFAKRNLTEALLRHSQHFIDALSFLRSPRRLLGLCALSILSWTLEGAVFATIAAAVDAAAQPYGPWFSLATGNLATLIPSSPGYVGTLDYFAAKGLAAYGSDPDVSVAFALTMHAVYWVPTTAVGLLYLFLHGVGRSDDKRRSHAVKDSQIG